MCEWFPEKVCTSARILTGRASMGSKYLQGEPKYSFGATIISLVRRKHRPHSAELCYNPARQPLAKAISPFIIAFHVADCPSIYERSAAGHCPLEFGRWFRNG